MKFWKNAFTTISAQLDSWSLWSQPTILLRDEQDEQEPWMARQTQPLFRIIAFKKPINSEYTPGLDFQKEVHDCARDY